MGAVECEELGSGWGFDLYMLFCREDKKVMADWRIQGWTPSPREGGTWTPTIKDSGGMYWGLVLCETWV